MISPDRKPGVKLVTDRLQAPRIGAPASQKADDLTPLERVIEEAETLTREAAKSE